MIISSLLWSICRETQKTGRLILCEKIARKPDETLNKLNIYRECICPGTEAKLSMTLEKPMLKKAGIDVHFIADALHDNRMHPYSQYIISLPDNMLEWHIGLLGGGISDEIAKTLISLTGFELKHKNTVFDVTEITHKNLSWHGRLPGKTDYGKQKIKKKWQML